MPTKLTKEQLDQIKYVSMADFVKRIDEIESIDDKRRFAAKYLARHGMGGNPDYTLAESVHIAKMKIGEASAKAKKDFYEKMDEEDLDPADYYIGDNDESEDRPEVVNPYAEDYKEDFANEYFMGHASEYFKNSTRELADAAPPENRNIIGATDEMDKYLAQVDEFNPTLETEILKLDDKPNAFEVRFRIDQKLGKPGALNELYNKTKPSFGASFFRTTSRASKNLDTAYKAFNNPNHAMYGDLATIEKAGIEYLEHKFPGWKRGMELPSEEDINKLSGTSKERALLSVNLINAAREQKEHLEATKGVKEMIGVAHHNEYSWNKVKEFEEEALKEEKSEELNDSGNELDNSNDESMSEEESEIDDGLTEEERFAKEFRDGAKVADIKNSLGELRPGQEMELTDEDFVEPEADPDDEIYAVDDPFAIEDDAVIIQEVAEDLGESWLDEAEIKRVENWKKQQAFQESLKEDLEGYDDIKVEIDTKAQEEAYRKGTLKEPKKEPGESKYDDGPQY